ncbi:cupin [Streptomyces sp. TRM70350]|uniref:cupin n=1 Tax=Streptomyces sp. TRM70350 TaxID=2856165 RepID=UPI001C45515B|nr:cupin [Streptomyces sp. TRM70350]MBV7700997.1 cupin [Streptomyces sp. TRM70350]
MTLLQIMPEDAPETVRLRTDDLDVIHKELLRIGVRLVRWHAARRLPADADDTTVMKAYKSHIDHLSAEGGYRIVDIVRMTPPPADTGQGRQTCPAHEKFLQEHVHDDDLVRFVVAGTGCFYLHVAGQVYAVLCTTGDLLSVPGRTPHWFDAGARPSCTAIRFFQRADHSAIRFLPDGIASPFPTHDDLLATPGN